MLECGIRLALKMHLLGFCLNKWIPTAQDAKMVGTKHCHFSSSTVDSHIELIVDDMKQRTGFLVNKEMGGRHMIF